MKLVQNASWHYGTEGVGLIDNETQPTGRGWLVCRDIGLDERAQAWSELAQEKQLVIRAVMHE